MLRLQREMLPGSTPETIERQQPRLLRQTVLVDTPAVEL